MNVVQSTQRPIKLFSYVYQYKDHLGNNRVTYTKDPKGLGVEILFEDHYYPFGLKHRNYNMRKRDVFEAENGGLEIVDVSMMKHKYKYNGMEWQDELSLNWYDYQARNYDPALGRWMNIDPLAENSRRWSPYNYCYNNPLRFVDPDGREADDVIIKGSEKQAAFSELQASVDGALTLNMDNNGNVTYTQNTTGPLTENAAQLATAIDDKSITVQITAENTYTTADKELYVGGAFMGNTVTSDLLTNITSVDAQQLVNPDVLGKLSDSYGKPGNDMLHEVTEAYQGALISQKSGISSPRAGQAGSVYEQAHKAATPQSGPVNQVIYDASGNVLRPASTRSGFPSNAAKVKYNTSKGTNILTIP